VILARQAMLDVLDRAKTSRDDDRILAAAKSVLSAHGASADVDEDAGATRTTIMADRLPPPRSRCSSRA
jgi:hypothetical protein